MSRSIAVTFDYRCPFAYNGNAAVMNAIRGGSDVDFRFVPFSLDQVHLTDDDTAVWDVPVEERGPGVRALLFGIAVRERHPDRFLDAHLALFAQRHDHGLRFEEQVLRDAVASVGLDPDVVAEEASSSEALAILADEAPTLHLYVRDLATTCRHRAWLDPGAEEWAEAVGGPVGFRH